MQVQRELTWLYAGTGARVAACVGGMDPGRERRDLAAGAHIVVGTPGRLRDHIERGNLDLAGVAGVVLDEADEMLDLGFREDLEFILDATPAERRTLLFSATMPREIATPGPAATSATPCASTPPAATRRTATSSTAPSASPRTSIEHAVVNLLR